MTEEERKKKEEEKRKEWEEAMLENNSYYDIDILNSHNRAILEEIKYWEEEFKPSGNMGKWYASVRIERLKKKLKHYENKGNK